MPKKSGSMLNGNITNFSSSTKILLELVKCSCFHIINDYIYIDPAINWTDVYELCKKHSVQCLAFQTIQNINISQEIKKEWEADTFRLVYNNMQVRQVEKRILNQLNIATIPTVILKGSSAAQYYTKPELRVAGDIDLLTKPEDHEKACLLLESMGCTDITTTQEKKHGRHCCYRIHNVVIELHKKFSVLPDEEIASRMDRLLFCDIHHNNHFLSPTLNGIVLLEHVYQHLETGIGLRQIIDWMMYVHSCLHDDEWTKEFQTIATTFGLDILAQTLTKMCQIYLGLEHDGITWCDTVDKDVCTQLFNYVLESGNFGSRRGFLQTNDITSYPSIKSVVSVISYLQNNGKKKWEIFDNNIFLKPFAWFCQGVHSIKQMIHNSANLKMLVDAYNEGIRRKDMFQKLGIKQRIDTLDTDMNRNCKKT